MEIWGSTRNWISKPFIALVSCQACRISPRSTVDGPQMSSNLNEINGIGNLAGFLLQEKIISSIPLCHMRQARATYLCYFPDRTFQRLPWHLCIRRCYNREQKYIRPYSVLGKNIVARYK